MTSVLPSTVEELNLLHTAVDPTNMYFTPSNQGFENIAVEKRIKREISLPNGVDWHISNFESYLNFEDNCEIIEARDDRLVPEGDQRPRCESISSVSSSMDDKYSVYPNMGVKTFSTICMDSGSTCVSSDHSYVNTNASVFKGLDAAETYENLDRFLQQVPDIGSNDTMSSTLSSVPSPRNDINMDLSISNSFSLSGSYNHSTLDESMTLKRLAESTSGDEMFLLNPAKRLCEIPEENRYHEIRRKNNIASKNCRKTRKEKQKDMEIKVADLEKERETLKVEVKLLEELIQAHKAKLFAILQKR